MEERDKHFMLQTYQVLGSKIKPKLENYQFYMLEHKEQHNHEEEFHGADSLPHYCTNQLNVFVSCDEQQHVFDCRLKGVKITVCLLANTAFALFPFSFC